MPSNNISKLKLAAIVLLALMLIISSVLIWQLANRNKDIEGVFANSEYISKIPNVREGSVFVRSDGYDGLKVTRNSLFDDWDYRFIIKKPDGSLLAEKVYKSTAPNGTDEFVLDQVGDYQVVITQGMRNSTFEATNKMVVETNARKRTFRVSNPTHATTKRYFYVPENTNSFNFNAIFTRGSGTNNEAKLYRPDGSTFTTLTMGISGMSFKTQTVSSPAPGFWSASISASNSMTEASFWLEGVANAFSDTTANWFKPNYNPADVAINIDAKTKLGERGLIGGSRVFDGNTTKYSNAFKTMKLEASEVELSHKHREPNNDNNDPFNLDLSKFNFTTSNRVDLIVTDLKAQPQVYIGVIPDWLAKIANPVPSSCKANYEYDRCMNDPTSMNEFAEAALAMVYHYNVVKNYNLKLVKLTDEPNIDPFDPVQYAKLVNTVGNRLRNHPDPRVNSVKLYGGSFSMMSQTTKDYIFKFIDNVDPNVIQGLSVHPWMQGYAGHGNIYSTKTLYDDMNEIMSKLESKVGTGAKLTFQVPELSPKYGDHSNQDHVYLNSFDNSIWLWSAIINLQRTGKAAAMSYYPFAEDGTIHNYRAMLYEDGSFKPIAYAAKFLMEHIQKDLISSEVPESREVEILTTKQPNANRYNLALVNKERRIQNLKIAMQLDGYISGSAKVVITKLSRNNATSPLQVSNSIMGFSGGTMNLPIEMDPESLYTVDIDSFQNADPNCGNGTIDGAEQCDEGNNNGLVCNPAYGDSCNYCTYACTTATVMGGRCGDGIIQTNSNEQCDNAGNNGVSCSAAYGGTCQYCNNSCVVVQNTGPYCGDGILQANKGEQCDDGNKTNGDGCSATCKIGNTSPPEEVGETIPVYRFWSPVNNVHFFTASEAEKRNIIDSLAAIWTYEGIAFKAKPVDQCDGASPVYRFWSDRYQKHFYTIKEAEKKMVMERFDDYTWRYEGISYCAFSTQIESTLPIFRFWSNNYSGHFYTIKDAEKKQLEQQPVPIWKYEGIGYYGVAPD